MGADLDVVEVGGDLIQVTQTSFDVIETSVDGIIEIQDTDLDVVTVSGDLVVVEGVGAQGPPGPAGAAGVSNLFISDTAPVAPPARYVWFQTDYLGVDDDFTMWLEDGDA